MGIFSRTRDIVAANVTDLLDGSKDPEKMIRMIILEMEETLVEVRASAARTIADQKEMRSSITRLEQLRDGWTEKAELALSRDREDLARQALIEKQKASDMADSLSREIAVLDATLRSYEDDIAKLQTKLRGARSRQSSVRLRLEGAHNSIKLREMTNGERVHDAFARFEMLERDVDYAEGRAEAAGMGSQPRTLEQEIEDLESNDRVDAELAAMKNAQGKKPAGAAKET